MPTKKILVQWMPTRLLAQKRKLALGSKFGSEVQQTPVPSSHPRFAELYLLSDRQFQGFPQILIGFSGETRWNGRAWEAVEVEVDHRFEQEPSIDQMADLVWEEQSTYEDRVVFEREAEGIRDWIRQLEEEAAERARKAADAYMEDLEGNVPSEVQTVAVGDAEEEEEEVRGWWSLRWIKGWLGW